MFAALALTTLLSIAQDVDPAKGVKSKDPLERLAAVEALARDDHPKRGRLLVGVLDDEDWEVARRAAQILGRVGEEDAVKDLADLALEGPVATLRRTAAESLAKIDAAEGYALVAKKVSGSRAEAACDAMCVLAEALGGEASLKPARKALKSKAPAARASAARALVRLAGNARATELLELLEHEEVRVRAAAVEAAGRSGDAALVEPLLAHVRGPDAATTAVPDIIERRVATALGEILLALDGAERDAAVAAVCAAPADASPVPRVSLVRILGRVASRELGVIPPGDAIAAVDAVHRESEVPVRAAVGDALGRIGSDPALLAAAGIARGDENPRVRRAALRGVTRRKAAGDNEEALDLYIALCADPDAGVREDAAVALAVKDVEEAVKPLVGLLDDPAWEVAVVAAVSLGKTRSEAALNPLAKLARATDWRLRGAAIVGLGHLYAKEAVPHIINAVDDADAVVSRAAHAYLVSIANREVEPEAAAWRTWWKDAERGIVLFDPEEEQARRDKYGYERTTAEIYEGLDVVVFESRGDHIQNVLADLDVEHRITRQGRVAEDAPHARSVFVSNCTGEMTGEDVGRLAWFVRVGGYLFGSCWAVQETVQRAVPGVVRRLRTSGEVMDDVPASPCALQSPYLEGVFGPDVTPVYALVGAYLIDVVDPERCEVLVDSPACYDRWGGGNLAAWFPAGHGVVLDSVNHFDEQGLARATWLKKPEERQAYAVDHLGLTLAELRELREEKWWKKTTESARQVKDLSVLRLVTNFVRQKRIAGDG